MFEVAAQGVEIGPGSAGETERHDDFVGVSGDALEPATV
jgi:hypothetical protein